MYEFHYVCYLSLPTTSLVISDFKLEYKIYNSSPHWSTQIESARTHFVLNVLATTPSTPGVWLISRHLISKDTSPRSAELSKQIAEILKEKKQFLHTRNL